MEENEITYIPYGLDEISQLDLMTSLADGVEGYLGSKRWARKDKYRLAWLNAYLNIINHGLTGASNETGVWTINHGKDPIDLSNMSNTEREMYLDAAYYIQQKMALMTPHKKEEENKDLEKFGNFGTNLMNQILKGYGNNSELFKDSEQGWDAQDARGADGLRGTKNRKTAMIKALTAYKDSLNDKDYNFEGTSFKDKADLQTKIQAAIDALSTNEETDDLPAFNALGLPYRAFFNNGGNDPYTKGDYEGTYSGYNEYIAKQNEAKQKAEQEKLKLQRANYWSGYKYYNLSKYNGRPLTPEESNVEHLNEIISKDKWSGDEASQIVQAFKLAEQNGQLVPITDKNELSKFGPMWKNRVKQLRKINGIDGIYYDTVGKKFVKPYKSGQTPLTSFLDILNLNNPEILALKQELENLKKIQQANNRKLSDGFEAEDYLRMGAMAQDLTGAVAAWVPGYGTAISGGLGLGSLATNFAADWADDSVTFGDMLKNAGINAGLAAVGMVPGLGIAAKSGKWLANIAKWTPRILTLASAGNIALSDDIKNSLKKASSVSDWNKLTNQDVKNITYALSTVAGLSRGTKGFVNNRKFKPAFSEGSEKQYSITTSKGKKTISKELVDKIKKLDPKDKEKYNEELKKILGLANDETVSSKDLKAFGKTLKSKGIEIKEESVPAGLSSRAKAYREYLENKNNQIKENHLFLSRHLKTDYDIYKGNTERSAPELAISDRIRNIWNPLSDRNLLKKGIKVKEETPTTSSTSKTSTETPKITSETSKTTGKKTWTEIEKEPKKWSQSTEAKEYKEMLKGNYSNNAIQGGTHKIGDLTIDVDIPRPGATNGFAEVTFSNGNKQTIRFDNLKQLQKEIAKIVKERRVQTDSSGKKTKVDVKEMSKILKSLKARGFLKQGGTINNPYVDTVIEDFFKNNNI